VNASPLRWRALLLLTAVVLAAHLALLRARPAAVQAPSPPQALNTRTIVLAPERLPAAAAPAEVAPAPVIVKPPRAAMPPLAKPATQGSGPATPRPTEQPSRPAAREAGSAPPTATSPDAPLAVSVPAPVLLRYQVAVHARNMLWRADSKLHWRHDGNEYEAKLELSGPLLPSRTQSSSGRITPEGLAPLRFSDKARSEEAAHFEREQGKVSFSSNRPDAALMSGAQDRLSVLLQLGAMIAAAPAKLGPGATIAIQTASTRDAETWQFTIEQHEQLQLPGGTVNAVKLVRNPRKEFDQKIELWLAPAMDYVPVRLRLTQPNGDWVDQQWSSTDKG
jgi:hypothetical protein